MQFSGGLLQLVYRSWSQNTKIKMASKGNGNAHQ
jgi:hypothetical protein